jgi:predicted acylesterase/phospholipase RssA
LTGYARRWQDGENLLHPDPPGEFGMSEASLEIRVALVLYGGVSLAIYENGVTRCFHDLVQKEGIYGPLLEKLLDARATVDVVAGTSAGGINGLMLAAAIENGSGFDWTAGLWRRLGDLEAMLRPLSEADEVDSLIDAEGYYREGMLKAFRMLCQREEVKARAPGEIDLFITGTDLDGRILTYWDASGAAIHDKTHRTVFHLKHRPGRCELGMARTKNDGETPPTEELIEEQAQVLTTLARITSSFPAAFPPFRIAEVDEDWRGAVSTALAAAAESSDGRLFHPGVPSADEEVLKQASLDMQMRAFVDGGVLDNKPFGPALRAIFYRMPSGLVDRRLFYVEPDPQVFKEDKIARAPDRKHTPLSVALRSLTAIPGHEGIAEDLERLKRHNVRAAWIKGLYEQRSEAAKLNLTDAAVRAALERPLYAQTRIEALAKALLTRTEDVPAADREFDEPQLKRAFEKLSEALRDRCRRGEDGPLNAGALEPCDVVFHLRRSFNILYRYSASLRGADPTPQQRAWLRFIGRVIKTQKLVRDRLYQLRNRLIWLLAAEEIDGAQALDHMLRFLDHDAGHWQKLREDLEEDRDFKELLSEEVLDEASRASREALREDLAEATGRGILEPIARVLHEVTREMFAQGDPFDEFILMDGELYPLEFASGVHELDEVEFIRVSPLDARLGLSGLLGPKSKVSGDELLHFSAFLRRDWRANDILWGRLDGTCRILESLLDARGIVNVRRRCNALPKPDDWASMLEDELTAASPEKRQELSEAYEKLRELWQDQHADQWTRDDHRDASGEVLQAERRFRDALILASQEQIFEEELPTVLQDVHAQEIRFGNSDSGLRAEADDRAVAKEATRRTTSDLPETHEKRWELFSSKPIGDQPVSTSVPRVVLAEWATHAYLLLWEMVRNSLGTTGKGVEKYARRYLRRPVRLLNFIAGMMRREFMIAVSVIAAVIALLAGGIVLGVTRTDAGTILLSAAGLLVFARLVVAIAPPRRRLATTFRVIAASLITALLVGAGWLALERVQDTVWPERSAASEERPVP